MNIIEGIQQECERCRKLLEQYKSIGPVGAFGHAAISADIKEGEAAIASGDAIRCISAYKSLQGCS